MKLPSIRRIRREDLKDAPDWISLLLYPLNIFMDTLYGGLDRGLTFQENIRSTIKTLELSTPADYATGDFDRTIFDPGLRVQPIGCLLIKIVQVGDNDPLILEPTVPQWALHPEGIQIRYISGLAPSTRYTATFLVF
jgi:hypothetical protein